MIAHALLVAPPGAGPVTAHALLALGVLLAVLAIVVAFCRATIGQRAQVRNRGRAIRWRIRLHLRPGAGYASGAELAVRWSRTLAVFHGGRGRPGMTFRARLTSPATDYAVRLGRAQWGRPAWARLEDQVLILTAPRVGKTGMLADRILTHPGPVVCTSTRADLFDLTAADRARRGPIAVFNPLGVGAVPSTFAWNLVDGCQDPAVAYRRAEALAGAVTGSGGDMEFWQGKAGVALAALLHAAALMPGATILDVFAWTNRHGDDMATQVLARHPLGSRAMLAALTEIQGTTKSADSVRLTMSKALGWVAIPAIAAAATPGAGEGFDAAEFVSAGGTLYMIAPEGENSPVAPLFRAFCMHLHYEAGMLGSLTRFGKLDPPLLLALDEVTQICPVPLPHWLSDSAGKGILICAVCHGTSQLEERWGREGAATIWATCGTKLLLGGISDPDTLDHVSRLCGSIEVAAGDGRWETVPILPPEVLRQLPDWRALVLRMNLSPTVVKVRPVWRRLSRRFGVQPARPFLAAYTAEPSGMPDHASPAGLPVPEPRAAAAAEALAADLAAWDASATAGRPVRPPAWVRGGDRD
jgi:type IV secretion system protein VirD4